MKKFNGRKLLALMMTLIMLLSLMPAAFADGEAEAAPAVQGGETPAEPTPLRLSRRLSRSTSPRSATSSMRLWTTR